VQFVQKRKIWYIISLAVIIPGLISLFLSGLNLGIDFTGGNILQMKFEQPVEMAELREGIMEYTDHTPAIQETADNEYYIRVSVLDTTASSQLLTGLEEKFGPYELTQNELIGPVMGKELATNAILALLIAFALMLVYIAFRFELHFAIAAVVPLIHDVLIVIGVFSLLKLEVDSTFVAAVLTVIGYSINNTIVVFDRVRENIKYHGSNDFPNLVDDSIRQTLTRSINTVLAVLFLLVPLLLFGGDTTKNFSLAVLIGLVAGTYSSMFIAGSLLVDVKAMARNKKNQPVKTNKKK
jgi:preprotein translocase subunit SecF